MKPYTHREFRFGKVGSRKVAEVAGLGTIIRLLESGRFPRSTARGDEWRVEFEAVVGRFSIQKNSQVPPSPSFAVRVLLWHGKQMHAFV